MLGGSDGENQGLTEEMVVLCKEDLPAVHLSRFPETQLSFCTCDLQEESETTKGLQLWGRLAWNWDTVQK